MAVKKVIFQLKLFVDGKQVADSTDFNLWQSAYKAIKRAEGKLNDEGMESALVAPELITDITDETVEAAISDFAKMIGINVATLRGVCDPKNEEPFIHLDMHFWADWKKNLPKRGRNSVGSIALSGTFLTLWFRSAKLGTPTLSQCQTVLDEIGITTKNTIRGINNCEWLQLRPGKRIQLNASAIDKAIEAAKAFCERRAPKLKPE